MARQFYVYAPNKIKPPRVEIRVLRMDTSSAGQSIPLYGVFDADESAKLFQGRDYECREFVASLYSDSVDEMVRIMFRSARREWRKHEGEFRLAEEADKSTRPGACQFPMLPIIFCPVDYDEAEDTVYYEVFESHAPDKNLFERVVDRKTLFEFGFSRLLDAFEAAMDYAERKYLSVGSDAERMAALKRRRSTIQWRYGEKGRRVYKTGKGGEHGNK